MSRTKHLPTSPFQPITLRGRIGILAMSMAFVPFYINSPVLFLSLWGSPYDFHYEIIICFNQLLLLLMSNYLDIFFFM